LVLFKRGSGKNEQPQQTMICTLRTGGLQVLSSMKYSKKDEDAAAWCIQQLFNFVQLKTNTSSQKCLLFNQGRAGSVTKTNSVHGSSNFSLIKMTA
jgi:hypothetical protein